MEKGVGIELYPKSLTKNFWGIFVENFFGLLKSELLFCGKITTVQHFEREIQTLYLLR
jgi:hypothetical protein